MNPYYLQQVERRAALAARQDDDADREHARGSRRDDPLRQRQEAEVLVRVAQRPHVGVRSRRSKASSTTCSGASTRRRATTSRKTSRNTCRRRPARCATGARLKPEALAVTDRRARTSTTSTTMSVEVAAAVLRRARADRTRAPDRAPDPQGDSRAAGLPRQRRAGLSEPLALGDDALGRRIAAHSSGDADRLVAGRRALHPRRTVDRAASARQRPAAGDAARRCATSATR